MAVWGEIHLPFEQKGSTGRSYIEWARRMSFKWLIVIYA
jgi:hypothetical protein